jgi:hypothetical protein
LYIALRARRYDKYARSIGPPAEMPEGLKKILEEISLIERDSLT